ncbi:MAG: hypothetical protein AMJ79_14350 [Phycisphaerae bacterium SM23_30]|nr:MAG: hypothetical protein AMJ79_14350 [Phycisphaerae bacterium SM23_30]
MPEKKNENPSENEPSIKKSQDAEEIVSKEKSKNQEIPPEVLEKLPSHIRESFQAMMVMSGQVPHPLISKLEPEHIHKIIDATEKDNQRDFQDKLSSRKSNLIWLLVICVFILAVFALFIFSKNTDLVVPIGTALLGFAGGFGSGFGVGRHGRER